MPRDGLHYLRGQTDASLNCGKLRELLWFTQVGDTPRCTYIFLALVIAPCVIASGAWQSLSSAPHLDCLVTSVPRNDNASKQCVTEIVNENKKLQKVVILYRLIWKVFLFIVGNLVNFLADS
jgi:predicted nucleic acid-binding Zn ribbon protein